MARPFDELVTTGVELQPYNTLSVSSKANYFAAVTGREQLQQILIHPTAKRMSKLVLGGGSNMLFVNDFDGLVLHVEIKGREVIKETGDAVWLKIGAGENWHETVRYCVEKGWGGIENLSLIPGTVGAAPIQNIGAYGAELEEVFQWLEAVELESGKTCRFENEECQFGYRDSIFKNALKGKMLVTEVCLKLSKHPELNTSYGAIREELQKRDIEAPTIRDISDIVIAIRQSKLPDPKELGNAGSFFKNPIVDKQIYEQIREQYPNAPGYPMEDGKVKVPAGWLIEATGWKGKEVGNTGTYKQQALVIVNHGGATGREIMGLARKIQQSVAEEFGIELIPEVNIID